MKEKVYKRVLLDSSRGGFRWPIGVPELIYYPVENSIIDVIKSEISKVLACAAMSDKIDDYYSKFGTYDNTIDGWFEEGEDKFVGIISSDSMWFDMVDSFHYDDWDDELYDKWVAYQEQACEDNALN